MSLDVSDNSSGIPDNSAGIVGLGTAGGAMYRGFQGAGFRVLGFDLDPARSRDSLDETLRQPLVLIAVPTPVDAAGVCDLAAVHSVLERASALGISGSIVVRSTLPVGGTAALMQRYPALKLGYSPEFLRAATADHDFLYPPMTLYAGHDAAPYFQAMQKVLIGGLVDHYVMLPAEVELVKLLLNGFAALKTIFSSELAQLASATGANWTKVMAAASLDGRLGSGYLAATGPDGHPGFDGPCLPKDTRMLAAQLLAGNILQRALEINEHLRSGIFKLN